MKSLSERHSIFLLILILFSSIAYPQNKSNLIFNDSTLQITEISANSIHSDFGPYVIQDTLYFATFNEKLFEKSDKKLKKKEFYDLYKAAIDKQGNIISKRESLEKFITSHNDGPVSWCAKTGELFVTRNFTDQSVKPKPFQTVTYRLKIIIMKQINGKWERAIDFPYNNPEYSVGHPAITESGDTLVFSSDKPGGYGETDLYYSIRKNGEWEIPVNLGPKINSSEKEEFAFLTDEHFDGRFLIFSSKGRPGNGGFDLYYTRFPSDYSEIVQFDNPINSQYDDFAMNIPADAEYGYLTSNRPGTGNDDIYKFNFKRLYKPLEKSKELDVINKSRELYVFDKASLRPISGVIIVSCDKQTYITDNEGKIASFPINENECEVTLSAFGYSIKTKVLLADKMNKKEISRDTILMDLIVNEKIVLKNINYDFDKWDILSESAKELDRLVSLMKENPEMKVELSSHTDEWGTIQYNLKLSQLRARAAFDYIVSKGIDESRIKSIGYGKSQLIHKSLGTQKNTPTQNRENRRTEFILHDIKDGSVKTEDKIKPISEIQVEQEVVVPVAADVNAYYIITGNFKSEKNAVSQVNMLKSEGYSPEIVTAPNGSFMVSAMMCSDLNKALIKKDSISKKFPGTWILRKESKLSPVLR